MSEISEPVRVELGLKLRSVQLHSLILSTLPYKAAFKDDELKARFGLGFAIDELCDCGHKALTSCIVKEGLDDNFFLDPIVNCFIFS